MNGAQSSTTPMRAVGAANVEQELTIISARPRAAPS